MSTFEHIQVPNGDKIGLRPGGEIQAPDRPIIGFIEGDGTGPDIWRASKYLFDAAVKHAYGGKREVAWMELFAGDKANNVAGSYLPDETLDAIREYGVAIKGPLTTPVGGGYRSLNVTLRQRLDLFACVRPVRHFAGVPSPVVAPEKVEDWDAYDRLREAGVDYFQGHFVSRPETVVRSTVRASKANLMGLLILLQDDEAALSEIVERINTDLALSYRLLRLVNSAAIGLRRRVDSVEEAVRLLGLKAVRSLVYLSALTGVDGKPPALVHNTMIRARFAELLAAQSRMANPPTAFLVGLFSNLDAFYNQPLAQLIDELPLTEDISRALLEGQGRWASCWNTSASTRRASGWKATARWPRSTRWRRTATWMPCVGMRPCARRWAVPESLHAVVRQ